MFMYLLPKWTFDNNFNTMDQILQNENQPLLLVNLLIPFKRAQTPSCYQKE